MIKEVYAQCNLQYLQKLFDAYVKIKDTMVYGEWSQRKSVMVKK